MLLNFGMGDAEYKRRFSNLSKADESLLFLKRNWRSQRSVACHRAFRSIVRLVRHFMKGRRRTTDDSSARAEA